MPPQPAPLQDAEIAQVAGGVHDLPWDYYDPITGQPRELTDPFLRTL